MEKLEAEQLITEMYGAVLHRKPAKEEFRYWVDQAVNGRSATELLILFQNSTEFRSQGQDLLQVRPGHFFSPIVNPATVKGYYNRQIARPPSEIKHVIFDLGEMKAILLGWKETLSSTRFAGKGESFFIKGQANRFFLNNGSFPYGDAAILRSMIADLRPRTIIEIGSGNSTCCMLDTLDEFGLETEIFCIEPYPEDILSKLINDQDSIRLSIQKRPVQDVPLEFFNRLKRGDILFIDSTHVMKTGSDVHYELFHILPSLASGVIVHFHDIGYPFEYPANWIFEKNWSWNEAYAVYAFLMYNDSFKIKFWLDMMKKLAADDLTKISQLLGSEPGSGIWLEKIG